MIRTLILSLFLCTAAIAQQVQIVIPSSPAPLKRNFLFSNPAAGTLILLYEVKTAGSSSLKVEVRNQKTLAKVRQYSIGTSGSLALRQADYRQPSSSILAVLQDIGNGSLSTVVINEKTGTVARFSLNASSKTPAVGLTWNATSGRWGLIAGSNLVSIDSSGRFIGSAPVASKGNIVDMTFNSCSSQYAVITNGAVRLVNANAFYLTLVPEEIGFDPNTCRYQVIRFERNAIVHLITLDSGLKVEASLRLPGQIAEGLIGDSRNVFVISKARKSVLYPTVEGHSGLYLNESRNGKITTRFVRTPVDSASIAMTSLGGQVFFLVSGLTSNRSTHQLALVKVPVPSATTQ